MAAIEQAQTKRRYRALRQEHGGTVKVLISVVE
jgi:hypothetical protein